MFLSQFVKIILIKKFFSIFFGLFEQHRQIFHHIFVISQIIFFFDISVVSFDKFGEGGFFFDFGSSIFVDRNESSFDPSTFLAVDFVNFERFGMSPDFNLASLTAPPKFVVNFIGVASGHFYLWTTFHDHLRPFLKIGSMSSSIFIYNPNLFFYINILKSKKLLLYTAA